MRWYLHVDMDAFFASVEQVLNPALRGKPVIVGGASGRGVVTSASYEARKYGVHSAMPGFQARKLCPNGIFLPNRHKVYSEFSHKVFAILEQYSPEVHAISIDEGVVDLTGTERLLGPPLKTANEILARLEKELGLSASGGLSTSRVVAKIAATLAKPHGLIHVPAGSEPDFLSPLPVQRIPGVGPKTYEELQRRGIKTIADLLKHPELTRRYLDFDEAQSGERSHDHSIGNETTLDAPLKDRKKMEEVLWELVEEVGGRLRKQELYARCITVKIRYTNFKTITRSRTLATPTCFDREIFEAGRELLRKNLTPGGSVRLLGISASTLLSSGWQESMFDIEKRLSWEKLYRGIDRLRRKYGDEAIGVATPHSRRQ
ncbi:MAG: DNA polymerase IV [Deltaproteobacteria bacterium]|nr:DNA polymerase IV [Deltaproteobacteria bacterium]